MGHDTLLLGNLKKGTTYKIYYSPNIAAVTTDGMITCAYNVDKDSKFCLRSLENSNGNYICRTKAESLNNLDLQESASGFQFVELSEHASNDKEWLRYAPKDADGFVKQLLLKAQNRNINTFSELTELVKEHLADLRKPATAQNSTEAIMLENPKGIYALGYFLTKSHGL